MLVCIIKPNVNRGTVKSIWDCKALFLELPQHASIGVNTWAPCLISLTFSFHFPLIVILDSDFELERDFIVAPAAL